MRKPASSSPASAKSTACCSKVGLKRGPWTPEEDELLANYINKEGEGRWRTLPKRAGLLRCGKSCRLRWMNYLRPSVKRGHIAPDEEDLILRLHRLLGNRWSLIAGRIPGRTDNEIKNYWNTHLSKKLFSQGIDPRTHKPLPHVSLSSASMLPSATNPNPRPTYNGVLAAAADGTHVSHIRANETTTAQLICSFDPTRNSNNINHHPQDADVDVDADADATSSRICSPVNSCKDADDADDVFSSFLNSLINEDMFACQTQQQLPRYDALLPNPSAVGLGWEAAPPPGFHLHHHQPQ